MSTLPASTQTHRAHFIGLYFDETANDSVWLRETATLTLPPIDGVKTFTLFGEVLPHSKGQRATSGSVGITVIANGATVHSQRESPVGSYSISFKAPDDLGLNGLHVEIRLHGAGVKNFLAWLGRVSGLAFLQIYRKQSLNRRFRIAGLKGDGETVLDFSQRSSPYSATFARRHVKLGLNLVGFFTADLGIGESVRSAAKSADAAKIPTALIDLKLNCRNSRTDLSFESRLGFDNPHAVNVIHVDAPQSSEIDHHHGPKFREGKYNIGYWAWELSEFPDAWVPQTQYFDEIWAPSAFVRDAIAAKSPVPVLAMPHAINFPRPDGNFRAKFSLPEDKFLFLFVFDLNSYAARKNPQAVLNAYRKAFPHQGATGLVIKVHNGSSNEAEFEKLKSEANSIPNTHLITETLTRRDISELQATCDCFVSLHRAEGFGFALAEAMFLGKPVISTDWSATAEFINASNGVPVEYTLKTLEQNFGPYSKGQQWAEANIDHAAWWMEKISREDDLRRRLGNAARITIEERFSPAAVGARYRRRLESIASW